MLIREFVQNPAFDMKMERSKSGFRQMIRSSKKRSEK